MRYQQNANHLAFLWKPAHILRVSARFGSAAIASADNFDRFCVNGDEFDAALWLAGWLDAPCPALGGQRPSDYLDTNEGIQVVRGVLARMESGAYA